MAAAVVALAAAAAAHVVIDKHSLTVRPAAAQSGALFSFSQVGLH